MDDFGKEKPLSLRGHQSAKDTGSLKRRARKEREKFPPVGEVELRWLQQVWKLSERQARFGHRELKEPEPAPPFRQDGLARQAMATRPGVTWQSRRLLDWHEPIPADPGPTRQSQDYWASYAKCAACPGPNRRQGKFAFAQGPNVGHDPDRTPT